MKVGGVFCGHSEERKSHAAGKIFHHKGETATVLVGPLNVFMYAIISPCVPHLCVCVCRLTIMMTSVQCVRTEGS